MFFGEVTWSFASFVFNFDVYTTLDQIFHHFVFVVLDCVENCGLPVEIDDVWVCSILDELLGRRYDALTNTIEDRCLTISVHVVHIGTRLDEQVNYIRVSFSDCVEQ